MVVVVDDDGGVAALVGACVDALGGPCASVKRCETEPVAAPLARLRVGNVGEVVRVNRDANRCKPCRGGDHTAVPILAVKVLIHEFLALGRISDVEFIVVIDDHVSVPTVAAGTTVNFGRVPPRTFVDSVHDLVISTVDVHDVHVPV